MPGLDATQIRRRLADARLYLCTPNRPDLAEFADAALAGGVDVVQLREKGMEARQELAALEVLAEACARHGALLAVNDRADVALAAGADVLHLGQDDLPVPLARRVVGDEVVIGRSTHDLAQASAAAVEPGVDYFCTGPCWPTPTKPGRPAPGLDLVRAVAGWDAARAADEEDGAGAGGPGPTRSGAGPDGAPGVHGPGAGGSEAGGSSTSGPGGSSTSGSGAAGPNGPGLSGSGAAGAGGAGLSGLGAAGAGGSSTSGSGGAGLSAPGGVGSGRPWFAIGGIDRHRLPEVISAGARRVVVVRAITESSDPRAAAAWLKIQLSGVPSSP
ncbi:thiamine-phosphate diphosphorylase [Actinosynnema pretiosum]|nr:thiamine-phosphate diphosphorylase [Actinosynnema pretiosum]